MMHSQIIGLPPRCQVMISISWHLCRRYKYDVRYYYKFIVSCCIFKILLVWPLFTSIATVHSLPLTQHCWLPAVPYDRIVYGPKAWPFAKWRSANSPVAQDTSLTHLNPTTTVRTRLTHLNITPDFTNKPHKTTSTDNTHWPTWPKNCTHLTVGGAGQEAGLTTELNIAYLWTWTFTKVIKLISCRRRQMLIILDPRFYGNLAI